MNKFLIENLSEVACEMYKSVVEEGLDDVMFVGLYEDVTEVLKQLLLFDNITIYQVDLEPIDSDGYDREFYITLDSDLEIWCVKAYNNGTGLYFETDTERLLVADDCNSALLKNVNCKEDEVYVVSYDFEEDEYNENEDNIENEELLTDIKSEYSNVSFTKDGKVAGFYKSWSNTDINGVNYYSSYSHYSSDEELVKKLAREFGIDI